MFENEHICQVALCGWTRTLAVTQAFLLQRTRQFANPIISRLTYLAAWNSNSVWNLVAYREFTWAWWVYVKKYPTKICFSSWWRHQMETFSALLALYAGNSSVNGEFPAQRPVTRSFDVFFDLRLNKRLSEQSRDWWFETPSRSLWRHRNAATICILNKVDELTIIPVVW